MHTKFQLYLDDPPNIHSKSFKTGRVSGRFSKISTKTYIYDYSTLPANFSLPQKAFGIPQIFSIAKANSPFLNFLLYLFPAPLLLLVLRTYSFSSSFQLSTPAFSLLRILYSRAYAFVWSNHLCHCPSLRDSWNACPPYV